MISNKLQFSKFLNQVLENQGLTEYIDDSVIRNTSREMSSALNLSPVALNAAADILVKEELRVRKYSNIV